jgi:ABC-type dipeptide/oligopeptide/nickel transport system ATPase component
VRGGKGRPALEIPAASWLNELRTQKERLELGEVGRGEGLPNLVYLEAETRSIFNPRGKPTRQMPESLYQWLVTYEGHDRWEGHIETMLRNLKLRNPQAFRDTLSDISNLLGRDKRLTDFDDNLRLRVQIGARKAHSHTLDELSAGERQCLILLFMASRWLMPGGVMLIDEPDLHLHVSLQRQLIHELKSLVQAKQGQLIISSHSPVMWEEYSSAQTITLDQIAHEQT